MAIDKLRAKQSISDEEFDAIYPEDVREHSNRHFTSVFLSQKAAQYLANGEEIEILDIGSGTGKFCLVGATCTKSHYTGVEHRKYLSDIAQECANTFVIPNVSFINANILDIDFKTFDAFYIFNPFLETHDKSARMDQSVTIKTSDYDVFKNYVFSELDKKKIGTRLATYWTTDNQIPDSFELKGSFFGDTLRFWEKIS
jgi:predicted RNA methylase